MKEDKADSNNLEENINNQFLDIKGVEVFSREFFKKVEELIDGSIIPSVNSNSLINEEKGE